MTTWWPILRFSVAGLALAAILRQLFLTVSTARQASTPWASHEPTVVANFFSYFTILSNLLAATALIIGGVWMMRNRRLATGEPPWLATLFACATTYILVTGIVYNLLLRSIPVGGIADVWTNETLHVVVPLALLLDAVLAPRRRPLPWRTIAVVVTFPILWTLYTMIRANFVIGPATGDPWWYPYPFLDPHLVPGGYLGVAAYILGIAAVFTAVAAGVVWIGRRHAERHTGTAGRTSGTAPCRTRRPSGPS